MPLRCTSAPSSGSGVLVLPGLAARLAGPASLLAWGLLSVASYPFAYTFASLSARNPESGGVYAFAKEAFGRPAAAVDGLALRAVVHRGRARGDPDRRLIPRVRVPAGTRRRST